jgi:multiple sugar transport system ATP-binding protein
MRAGRIEQIGDYHTLYDNPRNVFIATFVGVPTINLFEGYVANHRWYGEHFGPYPVRSDLADGASVLVGVRPESFLLDRDAVDVIITEAMPYFSERHQVVEVQTGRTHWKLILPLEPELHAGDHLRCLPDPNALLFFDAETGNRIG